MAILLNRIQWPALVAACCVWLLNAAVGGPVQALGDPRKTVLVLYGDPLVTPADRMTEQGLTAALSSRHASDLEVFTEYLDPAGPSESWDPADPYTPKRVVKGGSFLCNPPTVKAIARARAAERRPTPVRLIQVSGA